jgi:hypothetical protein
MGFASRNNGKITSWLIPRPRRLEAQQHSGPEKKEGCMDRQGGA